MDKDLADVTLKIAWNSGAQHSDIRISRTRKAATFRLKN